MNYDDILAMPTYGVVREEKNRILTEYLKDLTKRHAVGCPEYERFLSLARLPWEEAKYLEDLPFLPVRLFKELELKSVPLEEVYKTMTSSGTTGQAVSKIVLDKQTAANQQKTLSAILSNFLGEDRLPMLIVDMPSVIKNPRLFSARGAGILGFSLFGRKRCYALDDNMQLNIEQMQEFLEEHKGRQIFVFGFTFMIWQYFYRELKARGLQLSIPNGVLIHGGGWKKLTDQAVEPQAFRDGIREVTGIERVYDYYGMVEQTGCIYMECEQGHLHASTYSDVIVRRAEDFSVCDVGEEGILQVLSALPESYPGHSLLTEDRAVLLGEDDCGCGRKGKYFKVLGRVKDAEIRGCSDTMSI